MNEFKDYQSIFFIGVGGIGMSALARFFNSSGFRVAGYDRTSGPVTDALISEGIEVVFDESVDFIPQDFKDKDRTMVVYTPAVPDSQKQLIWFHQNGFNVLKRSRVLGLITENMKSICVAGTHGKTTVSTMTAFLFSQSNVGCNAFLGGISKNFQTNFLGNPNSEFVVLEADEFDRSFWQLSPQTALVTSMDADHLDIYGSAEEVREGFWGFEDRIKKKGNLLLKSGLPVSENMEKSVRINTYSISENADYQALNLTEKDGFYSFDLKTPTGIIEGFRMGVPGLINVENATAAISLSLINGVLPGELKKALPEFRGIARRFDVVVKRDDFVYIDDYAHHPEEIKATLASVRHAYPECKITGVFQPHLFSRTRDFAREFATALQNGLDEIILLPIYPAREEPIPGISSASIVAYLDSEKCRIVEKADLLSELKKLNPEVLITMGAGDIDRLVPEIEKWGEKTIS
ncbi:UDP-N-acetylmuramate--L-alanine ligase [Marinilabilia rubra]|uniref:UDP-N-acetylmuramate--L-alanine ligase n=1 Tax=Marinilabilia rubra TaxID=2162893 RepID=A0A2U2BEC5_9BACT|nr:UDP-N-acetylmuramate--L-alanine ligase [Marinilabilia rubra]PWE01412.1 UDP-N-acetylmuramate--L-alanine ligase [Marinilabilia rubra]